MIKLYSHYLICVNTFEHIGNHFSIIVCTAVQNSNQFNKIVTTQLKYTCWPLAHVDAPVELRLAPSLFQTKSEQISILYRAFFSTSFL